MIVLESLQDIIDQFDTFLIDQWGVLHDGFTASPGAIRAMAQLQAHGKTVILISNSGKPADIACKRLHDLGFSPEHYQAMITSGEHVRHMLITRDDDLFGNLGDKFVLFDWDGDRSLIAGTHYQEVDTVQSADF
ncbi:MAG: TIGR01459 family HAD-type hydrolase, partial [Pseudomonadota bacterium]